MIVHQLVGKMAGRLAVVKEGSSCTNPLVGYDSSGSSYGSTKYSSIDGPDGSMYEKGGGEGVKGGEGGAMPGSPGPPG